MLNKFFLSTLLMLVLFGCEDSTPKQIYVPQAVTRDDIGYYCNMIVEDHSGPKGQILLTDTEEAIWFTSVRDAVAFNLLPEEPKNIGAVFVTAMDKAEWNHPEKLQSNWIDAQSAFYVIKSSQRGSMGQMEAIPFRQKQFADEFVKKHGGDVVSYLEIPDNYILGSTN